MIKINIIYYLLLLDSRINFSALQNVLEYFLLASQQKDNFLFFLTPLYLKYALTLLILLTVN